MKWIAEGDKNLCLYYELTDEQLKSATNDFFYFKDNEFQVECCTAQGDNAHIFCLILNERRNIRPYVRELLKRYKTVSWWNEKQKLTLLRSRDG